ncbi:MAG: hypothetical protein ACI8RD_000570, partial [Bacillariaceae sp.]
MGAHFILIMWTLSAYARGKVDPLLFTALLTLLEKHPPNH